MLMLFSVLLRVIFLLQRLVLCAISGERIELTGAVFLLPLITESGMIVRKHSNMSA